MTPQKFWMVWVKDTPTTENRHPSYDSASFKADGLARRHSGKKVYVLEAVDYRWVREVPVTLERL